MKLGSVSCAKHLGGVRTVLLLPASEIESVVYNPSLGSFSLLQPSAEGELLEVSFAESGASWEEALEADGSVRHSLSLDLEGVQADVAATLQRISAEGVVAVVELCEGGKYLVGYSAKAAADYPLRLSKAALCSERRKEQRSATTLLLCGTDGWYSLPYQE